MRIVDFIPPGEEEVLSHDYEKSAKIKADIAFNAEHLEVMDITATTYILSMKCKRARQHSSQGIFLRLLDNRPWKQMQHRRQIAYFNILIFDS